MRSLHYKATHKDSGSSIVIHLDWETYELKIHSPKNPCAFDEPEIPANRKQGSWISREVEYKDTLSLEELLLLTRLTMLPPESSGPDFPKRRLLIRSQGHTLDLGWHGEMPPLHWSPLQELVLFLENLHQKYITARSGVDARDEGPPV